MHNDWNAEATHTEALLDLDNAARLRKVGPLEHAIVHAKAVGLGEEHLEHWANLLQIEIQFCLALPRKRHRQQTSETRKITQKAELVKAKAGRSNNYWGSPVGFWEP